MSYINRLRETYSTLFVHQPGESWPSKDFRLFRTSDDEIIGIASYELSDREYSLLAAFLKPVDKYEVDLTNKDLKWKNFINGQQQELHLDAPPYKIRFIFFSVSDPALEPETFREALQAFFPAEMPLIWISSSEGIIIEEFFDSDQEPISLENVIDVLMSDFYTKLRFYISEEVTDLAAAQRTYKWAYKCFSLSSKYQLGETVSYHQVLPFVYIDGLSENDSALLKETALHEVESDRDLLRTIKVFLESGSNASLAAKLLFMHRNSLQYRVDKFIEKTGIDIKQFEQGLVVYLLLLQLNL
ncbi:CdaR family transcriptional regulator [Halobacillus sp. A5]|uniref:PucR family transcriptional regulator n=1 Tax=Halobacillus sp. A5 TaxID=2880263 RepID=UPI0020A69FB2|nr:helix-turn-helix domain-containing protein [Halobacillus sp. A5]MCP3026772.1 helix-turn-helix domain-containing protein [Halobacillus sp. A5]